MSSNCASCKFWRPWGPGGNRGLCRRRAPERDREWPKTARFDWCGEHEAKSQDDSPRKETDV